MKRKEEEMKGEYGKAKKGAGEMKEIYNDVRPVCSLLRLTWIFRHLLGFIWTLQELWMSLYRARGSAVKSMRHRSHASAHTCAAPLPFPFPLGTQMTFGTFHKSSQQQPRQLTTVRASLQLRHSTTSFPGSPTSCLSLRPSPEWRSFGLGFVYAIISIWSHLEADTYRRSVGFVRFWWFWQVPSSFFLSPSIPFPFLHPLPLHT